MKKFVFFTSLLSCLCMFPSNILGCSYIETDIKLTKNEVKKFYREQFKGAVFIGKILSIKEVTVKWFDEDELMKEVSIEVNKYWFGVEKSKMIVYTGTGGGDCGVDFEIDKRYFLSPDKIGGLLWANIGNSSIINSISENRKRAKPFDKLFGEGKIFQENKQ